MSILMSGYAVQIAKQHRAEQIRAAEESRVAAMCRGPRRSPVRRCREIVTAAVARIRKQRPALSVNDAPPIPAGRPLH
jgi:lipid A disaccharide synthetase